MPRVTHIVDRRVGPAIDLRRSAFPVVALTGARAVGKSVLLRAIADRHDVEVIDLDDLETRPLVAADPTGFVTGPEPVCIDEFQHVPLVLDAIKAELNRQGTPGRYVITGSTRYDALPRAAQSLTGRVSVVPVWPLSQGEIDGTDDDGLARLMAGPLAPEEFPGGESSRDEYRDRVLTGGFPQPLALPEELRPQWFSDYIALVCQRDVVALSKVRQRDELPRLLARLADQSAQLLNVSDAGRAIGLERSTAENYTRLMEAVFLLHRLPAWGTGLSAKSGAAAKVHLVDTGVAAHLMGVTDAKLVRRMPAALTRYGHLLETFVVNEILKQASRSTAPMTVGHWRDRNGAEVDLVVEQHDGDVLGVEVKAAAGVSTKDANGLRALSDRLPERWIGGVVLHTGTQRATLDADRRIIALPIDALWR